MSKIEKYQCDTCEVEMTESGNSMDYSLQVIFITNQEDGKLCEPYHAIEIVDLCKKCKTKILNEKRVVLASGCQGFNKYCIHGEPMDKLKKANKV